MSEPIPETPDGVIPYLTVVGGDAAIDFYTRAFGAKTLSRMPTPDGKRLMNAHLKINNGSLMLSDDFPDYNNGVSDAPPPGGAVALTLHIQVSDCDAAFAKAIAEGAKELMPPADMFWGDRFAKVRDPFGHSWSIAHTLQKK